MNGVRRDLPGLRRAGTARRRILAGAFDLVRAAAGTRGLAIGASIAGGAGSVRAQGMLSPQEQQLWIDRELNRFMRGVPIKEGRVKVDVPVLTDNGNSVSCAVTVDSPMTKDDHVREVHLLLARNPRPLALTVAMGPDTPRAYFETRVRLAGSQRVMAVAVMNDGSAWSGFIDVTVSVSACLDGS